MMNILKSENFRLAGGEAEIAGFFGGYIPLKAFLKTLKSKIRASVFWPIYALKPCGIWPAGFYEKTLDQDSF